MARMLAWHAVLLGLLVPTWAAAAAGSAPTGPKAVTAAEQGRPLWSICGPRNQRVVSRNAKREKKANRAESQPIWTDCALIGEAEPRMPASSAGMGVGVGMSSEDDEEPPICTDDARCSRVPTQRSEGVYVISVIKAVTPTARLLPRRRVEAEGPPDSIGRADDGYPSPPFEPPRRWRMPVSA